MADYLSNSKRNFVERWKKSVDHYTTKGHLCKETITDVPPERDGVISPCSERSLSMTSHSPLPTEGSSHFPIIHHTYIRNGFDAKHLKRNNHEKRRLRLPPSPKGMLVHHPPEVHRPWFLYDIRNPEVNAERPDVAHSKEFNGIGKKSSKLAKEIFDKYNMKSDSQNTLPGKHIYNGFQQLSMPWRNKTFLTLPVRLNGSIRMKNAKYLDSDQISISSQNADFGSNVSVMSSETLSDFGDWQEGD